MAAYRWLDARPGIGQDRRPQSRPPAASTRPEAHAGVPSPALCRVRVGPVPPGEERPTFRERRRSDRRRSRRRSMSTGDGHSLIASDPETRRALELDTLAAILPMDRRDRLAELLTDDDVATLTHLARAGMGANTLRALASDLAYLETWAWAVLAGPLPWPAPEALILRFVAHHLWDPVQRETDPLHGMPEAVASILRTNDQLRVDGPHAPATVRRRLAHWSTLNRGRGLIARFGAPNGRQALRLATRAARRPRGRNSERPVTRDVRDQPLATWDAGRLIDLRDRALLLVAFASGGRRRSEAAALRVADLIEREP